MIDLVRMLYTFSEFFLIVKFQPFSRLNKKLFGNVSWILG